MCACATGSRGFLPGFPWKGRVRACATGSYAISDQTSPVGIPLENMVARMHDRKCPWGCSLGHPGPITLSFSTPFTGYLPLSRYFIFMGSAFNNFLQKFVVFGYVRGCCVVLQVVYDVRVRTVVFLLNNLRVKSLLA